VNSQPTFSHHKEEYASKAGWFLNNNDIHSLMLYGNAELDLLHHRIFQILANKDTGGLQMDELAMELVEKVMAMVSGSPAKIDPITESLKRYHLGTIENAKSTYLDILPKTFHYINWLNTVM
jgi:hypothetical protein